MSKASKHVGRTNRKHLPLLSLSPSSLRTHFLSELLKLPVQPPGIPAGTFQLCTSLPPLLYCLNTTVSLLPSLQRLGKYLHPLTFFAQFSLLYVIHGNVNTFVLYINVSVIMTERKHFISSFIYF